jgi:O-antigen ligase
MRVYFIVFLIQLCWLTPFFFGPIVPLVHWFFASIALSVLGCFGSLTNEREQMLSRTFISSIVLASVVSAVLGLLQFSQLISEVKLWIVEPSEGVAYANLRQRNQLASLLVMGLVAILCFECLVSRPYVVKMFRQWIEAACISLLMCCLAATGSRTGTLQLLASLIFVIGFRRKLGAYALHGILFALLLYCLCVLVMPWLSQLAGHSQTGLLSRLRDPNAFSRIALWSNVLELIAQKPFMGHGWGSLAYAHYSTEFSGARFMEMLDNAHNLPLHLAVELGLPVALAFCGLVMWGIVKGRPWEESRPDRLMAWGILGVIGIHSMLEYPLWYGPFFLTALICVVILLQDVLQFYKRKLSVAGIKYTQFATKIIAIGLLCCTGFLVFDYHRVSQIYLQPEERSSWYADDALGAAQKSVLFQSHAKFAELVITPLSRANAPRVLELSSELIHWSPEPRVIEKLIESAVMMGLDDVAAFHLKRYRVAYPQAYAQWAARSGLQPSATMPERTPLTSAL